MPGGRLFVMVRLFKFPNWKLYFKKLAFLQCTAKLPMRSVMPLRYLSRGRGPKNKKENCWLLINKPKSKRILTSTKSLQIIVESMYIRLDRETGIRERLDWRWSASLLWSCASVLQNKQVRRGNSGFRLQPRRTERPKRLHKFYVVLMSR